MSVAGLSLHVSGVPASAAPVLQFLLSAMSHSKTDRIPDVSVCWDGRSAVAQPGDRRVRAGSLEHIPSLTLILLLERLRAAKPCLHILHGNAVAVSSSDRALLLVGNSGAGKTTLTSELVASPGNRLIAEDSLLLDLDREVLHPFPRAASLRMEAGTHGAPHGALRWRGLGARRVEKALVAPQRVQTTPLPLGRADIVLLEDPDRDMRQGAAVEGGPGETYWMSHADASLPTLIRDRRLPEASLKVPASDSTYPSLSFPAPLDGDERRRLVSLLASHGIMILASHPAGHVPLGNGSSRPSHPVIQHASPFDGLRRLLEFSVAFGAPDLSATDPPRLLMRLAHVFNGTRFLRLIPGGSPADTIACLGAALDTKL